MRKVKGKNTVPEICVRSIVHKLGYRFRLHDSKLPGSPDLVLRRLRKIILVNGCFWHSHPKCKRATVPTSNVDYWRKKLKRNRQRDREALLELGKLGWKVLVVWECQMEDPKQVESLIGKFLSSSAVKG